MADPLISLDTEHASVQPGGQVRLTVTVTNTGNLVEGFWLQVLGPAAAWAEIVPPEISVYPQQDASAVVIISPPSDNSALSGLLPFGVLASSMLDAASSAAAEGDLEIGELHSLQAKIIPVTSTGRWRGRHVIQLNNWGNSTAQLQLVAANPDDALGFYLSPTYVDLPPGGQATVRLSARTKHPFLRGTPVRLPFQVIGEPVDGGTQPPPATPYGDPSRPVIDAALNQKPILSKGVITLLALLLVGIVAVVAFVLTRPDPAPLVLAPRGSPPKTVLRVVGSTPDSITVAWDQVDLAQKYTLQQVDETGRTVSRADPLDAALNTATVKDLPAETKVCFRLTVTRAGIEGPPSEVVCGTTTAAVATPTPTPIFSPGDPNTDPVMKQQWIAVTAVQPKTVAESDVQLHVSQMITQGLDAKYLDSRFYPRMLLFSSTPPPTSTPDPEGEWVIFVGPFPTQTDVDVQCPVIIAAQGGVGQCFAAQPDPPQ
jgi:hypothetical protein